MFNLKIVARDKKKYEIKNIPFETVKTILEMMRTSGYLEFNISLHIEEN